MVEGFPLQLGHFGIFELAGSKTGIYLLNDIVK